MSWIQVNQKQEVEPAANPAFIQYRLTLEVVASFDIEPQLFVFAVTDDVFSHVATLDDLRRFPPSKAQAIGENLLFYRASKMSQVLTNKVIASDAATAHQARLKRVNLDWGTTQTVNFGGVETFVYDSTESP